jgi:hypothetical protein
MSNNLTKKADHLSLFRVCTIPSRRRINIRKTELMGGDTGLGGGFGRRGGEWNIVQEEAGEGCEAFAKLA